MYTVKWLIRKEKKSSIDLLKAFFYAFSFHVLFVSIFHVASKLPDDKISPLPFSSVEIDLGEKEINLLPSTNEIVLIFPEENPMMSLFSFRYGKQLDEREWMKKQISSLSEPDFSSIENLPYTISDN